MTICLYRKPLPFPFCVVNLAIMECICNHTHLKHDDGGTKYNLWSTCETSILSASVRCAFTIYYSISNFPFFVHHEMHRTRRKQHLITTGKSIIPIFHHSWSLSHRRQIQSHYCYLYLYPFLKQKNKKTQFNLPLHHPSSFSAWYITRMPVQEKKNAEEKEWWASKHGQI